MRAAGDVEELAAMDESKAATSIQASIRGKKDRQSAADRRAAAKAQQEEIARQNREAKEKRKTIGAASVMSLTAEEEAPPR